MAQFPVNKVLLTTLRASVCILGNEQLVSVTDTTAAPSVLLVSDLWGTWWGRGKVGWEPCSLGRLMLWLDWLLSTQFVSSHEQPLESLPYLLFLPESPIERSFLIPAFPLVPLFPGENLGFLLPGVQSTLIPGACLCVSWHRVPLMGPGGEQGVEAQCLEACLQLTPVPSREGNIPP